MIESINDPKRICDRLGYAIDLAGEAMELVDSGNLIGAIAKSAEVRGIMGEVVYSLAVKVATIPLPIARPCKEEK